MTETQPQINARVPFIAVTALGLVGAGLLMGYSRLSLPGLVIGVFMAGAGAGLGWWLKRWFVTKWEQREAAWSGSVQARIDEREAYTHELERLSIELFPILVRQIVASRELAETNITGLSARFADLVRQLEQVVEASQSQDSSGGVSGLFQDSHASLSEVVRSLGSLVERQSTMVEQVQGLAGAVGDLDAMAKAVRSVAEQINVLALNAAIEAARAGEHGRGFAVVADEVRKLAASSAQTGEKIGDKIKAITASMDQTQALVENASELDDRLIDTSESTIQSVLERLQETVGRLNDDAASLRDSSERIRVEISDVLVGLQFQDRLSQVLGHVENTLHRVGGTLSEIRQQPGADRRQDMLRVDEMLGSMLAEYSTQEEVDLHLGHEKTEAAGGESELTFF